MNTGIIGIGWMGKERCGGVSSGRVIGFSNLKELHANLQEAAVLDRAIKNYGRLDHASKMACCTIAMGIDDAGLSYADGGLHQMGLVAVNPAGCLDANRLYFEDYIDHGRSIARGNLFVYTLPSSPLADAAIHFGCQGPLLYQYEPAAPLASILNQVKRFLADGDADRMAVYLSDDRGAICLLISARTTDKPFVDGEESTIITTLSKKTSSSVVDTLINKIARPMKRGAFEA